MRNVSDKIYEKIKTHFIFNNVFFNHTVYETMWKNIIESGRPQVTIWRMHIACWIITATPTLRVRNTYSIFTATMVRRTRLSVNVIRLLSV